MTHPSPHAKSSSAEEFTLNAKVGVSHVHTHFGEILQGQFLVGADKKRALVTLPCPYYFSTATFCVHEGGTVTVDPARSVKAQRAAQLALKHLGCEQWGGHLQLLSNIPESIGAGSSSGDVVAAIRAVAKSFNTTVDTSTIAHLAVAAETACDSIMYDKGDAVLFAQREGTLLETFGRLPKLQAIGVVDGGKIDTLAFPPAQYNDSEIQKFMDLLDRLRGAVKSGNSSIVAEVATASAEINQKYLPKPNFRKLLDVASSVGALGISVSHSGSAVSFLFDGAKKEITHNIENLKDSLSCMGKTNFVQFEPSYPLCLQCNSGVLNAVP